MPCLFWWPTPTMQIMRFLLAIAAAPLLCASTLSLAQAPPHLVNSKAFAGHDKPSEFIGATDELVFLTRNAKVKGGLVGVLECYRRQDLELVCQLPLNLPVKDADEYVRVGGLLVKEAPAIIYTYNKKGKGRAVDLAVLDPSTGEVSSHVNLMTVPGGSDQTVGEVRFVRDVLTGQVVVLAQKRVGDDGILFNSSCQVVAVAADGQVSGPVEIKLGEGGYAAAKEMAFTGGGQVVVYGRALSAVQSADKGPCMTVVDLAAGTSTALEVPDGKEQGGVCAPRSGVVLTRLPDGRVALHQPFTKKGVPGYGFSGLLTTTLSASGALEGHTLYRLGTRDVVKHDTKQPPHLVGMVMNAHWTTDAGTWMFQMRRTNSREGGGDMALLEVDPAGDQVACWIMRTNQGTVVALDRAVDVVAIPGPGNTCRVLMTELPENVGRPTGKDLAEWTVSKVIGGDLTPCQVLFDGSGFGPITAVDGLADNYTTLHALHRDPVKGTVLVQWLHSERVAFTEVGP